MDKEQYLITACVTIGIVDTLIMIQVKKEKGTIRATSRARSTWTRNCSSKDDRVLVPVNGSWRASFIPVLTPEYYYMLIELFTLQAFTSLGFWKLCNIVGAGFLDLMRSNLGHHDSPIEPIVSFGHYIISCEIFRAFENRLFGIYSGGALGVGVLADVRQPKPQPLTHSTEFPRDPKNSNSEVVGH